MLTLYFLKMKFSPNLYCNNEVFSINLNLLKCSQREFSIQFKLQCYVMSSHRTKQHCIAISILYFAITVKKTAGL